MLDQTIERLSRLSPDLRRIAEEMAYAIMASELNEDFIPPDQAADIATDHRVEDTEDWKRAVNAAVSSLLALHSLGYGLHRA